MTIILSHTIYDYAINDTTIDLVIMYVDYIHWCVRTNWLKWKIWRLSIPNTRMIFPHKKGEYVYYRLDSIQYMLDFGSSCLEDVFNP